MECLNLFFNISRYVHLTLKDIFTNTYVNFLLAKIFLLELQVLKQWLPHENMIVV